MRTFEFGVGMNKKSRARYALALGLALAGTTVEGCDCGEVLTRPQAFLAASETQIDFGDVPVGFDVTRVFAVQQEGGRKVTVDGFSVTPDGAPFAVEGGTVTLGLKGKQDYILHFRPTAVQAYEADLVVLHDGDNEDPVRIQLRGEGIDDQVCTDCGGKPPECLDEDVQIIYENIGGCAEDQCLYQAVQNNCVCGCETATGLCLACEDAGVPLPPPVRDAGANPADAGAEPIDAGEGLSAPPDAGSSAHPDATCDLKFVSYDPATHQVAVEMLDATNCGCNEATKADGSTCGPNSSSTVNNNENVTHLVFGLHYEGLTEPNDCIPGDNIHPGWAFATPPYQPSWWEGWDTGETMTEELSMYSESDWDCLLDNPMEGRCWEIVIWQINYSQTADTEDFPAEGWTTEASFNGTQMYPDVDLGNNRIVFCP